MSRAYPYQQERLAEHERKTQEFQKIIEEDARIQFDRIPIASQMPPRPNYGHMHSNSYSDSLPLDPPRSDPRGPWRSDSQDPPRSDSQDPPRSDSQDPPRSDSQDPP